MKQQAMSRLENPAYGKPTLTTLKRFAAACDVGLLVEFIPFSQLINRITGTPYIEHGLSPATMDVPSFDEEDQKGVFAPAETPVNWQIEPQFQALPTDVNLYAELAAAGSNVGASSPVFANGIASIGG